MGFDISQFRTTLSDEGARANLFEVSITVSETENFAATDFNFYAKSSVIPGTTLGTVVVPYFGREIKFAGNRTYGDWTITVINDEGFTFRAQFENWINRINSITENTRASTNYTGTGTVTQYSKSGATQVSYDFINMFPTDLGEISLDWGDNDSIEEYTVTFAYDYWIVGGEE